MVDYFCLSDKIPVLFLHRMFSKTHTLNCFHEGHLKLISLLAGLVSPGLLDWRYINMTESDQVFQLPTTVNNNKLRGYHCLGDIIPTE